MIRNSPIKKQLFRSRLHYLVIVVALLASIFGFQLGSRNESVFGEYIYYDFMSAEQFNPNAQFSRYTSHANLVLNRDSTYSYFSVQDGVKFTSDSGSFSSQGSTLTFRSKFGDNDKRGKTYYTGPYGTEKVNTFIYVENLEYIDLQACDTNCLTVFFNHNLDSALSYLEFGLGNKDRLVKLQGEFLPKKSYCFKYPQKEWKKEELFTLIINLPELHFAQKNYEDGMFSTLEDIRKRDADTLIITLTQRREDGHPLYREGQGRLPQRLNGLKMLWERDRLYLQFLKEPEKKQWVWDRKYNWLQKKRS